MKNIFVVNLTPHPIVVVRDGLAAETIPPSGTVARVSEIRASAGAVEGLPVVRVTRGAVEGLPEAVAGTIYLVSGLVLGECPGRADVFAPDTGAGAVRDAQGRILGTRGLIAAPEKGGGL